MMKSPLLILVSIFFVGSPFYVQAQLANVNALTFQTEPANPQPFTEITVSANSFAIDMINSEFTWYVDGVQVAEGRGIRTIKFTTKSDGTVHTINVLVVDTEGRTEMLEHKIRPLYVDLIWQADTTVPPLYKGKALLGYESPFKVLAIVSGFRPQNLLYTWRLNGDLVQDQSGYGRNTFVFDKKTIKLKHEVSVDITLPDGTVGRGGINLTESQPRVVLYEKKPLLGVNYGRAMGSIFPLTQSEFIARAEPYFFRKNEYVDIFWRVNGRLLDIRSQEIPFVREGSGSGRAVIRVDVSNPERLLQSSRYETTVNY